MPDQKLYQILLIIFIEICNVTNFITSKTVRPNSLLMHIVEPLGVGFGFIFR